MSRKLPPLHWKLHLASPPAKVFEMLTTDAGRERYWAERSTTRNDVFTLQFPGKEKLRCQIVRCSPFRDFAFRYFGNTLVEFTLKAAKHGGTDLTLRESGFRENSHRTENYAGWIQVLLCLKAAVDYGVDLRNHDPRGALGRTVTARIER